MPRLSRRQALALAGSAAVATVASGGRVSARTDQTAYGLTIQPRSVWAGDSRPPQGELGIEDVRFLLVHHTASSNGADPVGTMRGVYDFHTSSEKGWPDVAYNFFVDQNGVVYEARSGSLAGPVEASATGGNQGFAQLVCLLGDFTSQNPTDAALASLNATLAWLADRYALDTSAGAQTTFTSRGSNRWPVGSSVIASTISGHRDMSRTACPGDTFYPYLVANVQQQVHQLRASGAPPTSTQTPSTTSAPFPESTTTTSISITTTPPTSPPPSTSGATTVADGTVVAPPAPAVDEFATDTPNDVSSNEGGRDSANRTALAVAAGAAVLVGGGALYVGMRGRNDAASPPGAEPLDPPPDGSDPLA